jgi:hypothetical protein
MTVMAPVSSLTSTTYQPNHFVFVLVTLLGQRVGCDRFNGDFGVDAARHDLVEGREQILIWFGT